MSGQTFRRLVVASVGGLCIAGSAVLAQGVLAQLQTTEANAQQMVLDTFSRGGVNESTATTYVGRAATVGYSKIALSARGPVTTALYAWTKAYVNTPAFKKAYAAIHTEHTPDPFKPPVNTVDEELKSKLDAFRKMGAKENPELVKGIRAGIEEERAKAKATHEAAVKEWHELYPADPMVAVARALREFVNNTADVDFAAKRETRQGEAGNYLAFANEAYNKKPWQWQEAYLYGPETLAAARTAAAAWLKELGK